jgi:hypothetical protein
MLHADDVAYSKLVFNPGKERALFADIAGLGMLKKRMIVGAHAEDAHRQVDRHARLGALFRNNLYAYRDTRI